MWIESMTARFGGLDGETLPLSPGLNIIHAPNEGGKSTWCAFLRAMFYGIPTRERDKKDTIAEKNRYQPWSGAPMEGKLSLHRQGEAITLLRTGKPSAPFGLLQAIHTETGDPVPGLTAEGAGETLLGVSREVYERTAFVTAPAFDGAPELERRVAALASSGEEDVSYSQAESRLRAWRNARRHNRTGALPRLEVERAEVREMLSRATAARRRMADAGAEVEALEARAAALEQELAAHRTARETESRRQYEQARAALDAAVARETAREQEALRDAARLEADAHDPLFDGMSPEDAVVAANADAAALDGMRRGSFPLHASMSLTFGGVGLVALVLLWVLRLLSVGSILALAAIFLFALASGIAARRAARRRAAILARYDAACTDDIRARAYAYGQAHSEAAAACDRAAAYAGARREYESQRAALPPLPEGEPPAPAAPSALRPLPVVEAEFSAVRGELARATQTVAMARGELATLGDAAHLEARQDALTEQLAVLGREYDALTAALEGLSAANAALRARFSPAVSGAAGEVFSALTGGAYSAVSLTREFEALGTPEGTLLPRRALALSQGTADQLYLSVRLALCDLVLPGDGAAPPIVLDDALAHFDDARMALALDYLAKWGARRQILLFSCHTREGDYAAAHLSGRANVLHFI